MLAKIITFFRSFSAQKSTYKSLMQALKAHHEAFILSNSKGEIIFFNQKAENLFEHISLKASLFTFLRMPIIREIIEEIKETDKERISEHITLRIPSVRNIHLHALKCDHNILFHFQDITEQKQALKMHGDFVANVSHELRTPLASILGFIETIQLHTENDPEIQKKFLDIMHNQATRMNHLINSLLSLSRAEMDQHIEPQETCDLTKILEQVSLALAPLMEKHHMTFHCKFDNQERLIKGIDDQIFQIFQNITENAIKYSDDNTNITFDILDTNDKWIVHIIDQGYGIQEDHIPRLTERFYRTDNARNRSEGGAGLGLSIVSKIIQRHKGTLEIASKVGEGSNFMISFPKKN